MDQFRHKAAVSQQHESDNLRNQLTLMEERHALQGRESQMQIQDLQDRVKQLEEQNSSLQTEYIQIEQAKLREAQAHSLEMAELDAKLQAFQQDNQFHETDNFKLQQELASVYKQLKATRRRHKESNELAEQKIKQQNNSIHQLNTKVVTLHDQNESYRRQINDMAVQLNAFASHTEQMESALRQQNSQKESYEQKIVMMQDQVEQLQSERHQFQVYQASITEAAVMKTEKTHLEQKVNELQTTLQQTTRDNQKLKQQNEHLDGVNRQHRILIDDWVKSAGGQTDPSLAQADVQRQLDHLTNEAAKFQNLAKQLEDELDKSNHQAHDLQVVFDDVMSQMTTELSILQRSMDKVVSGDTNLNAIQARVLDQQNQLGIQTDSMALRGNKAARDAIQDLHRAVQGVLQKFVQTYQTLEETKEEMQADKRKYQSKQDQMEQTKLDMEKCRHDLSEMQLKVRSLQESKNKETDEIESLRTQLDERNIDNKRISDQLEKLRIRQAEMHTDKKKMNVLEQDYATLEGQADLLKTANEELRSVIQNLEKELGDRNKKLNATLEQSDQMFHSLRLVMRTLLPASRRIQVLSEEKNILLARVRSLEKLQGGIYDLVQATSGVLTGGQSNEGESGFRKRKRPTIRVVALFLLAANRLSKLGKRKNSMVGSSIMVGGEHLYLLDDNLVSDDPRLPLIFENTPLQQFIQKQGKKQQQRSQSGESTSADSEYAMGLRKSRSTSSSSSSMMDSEERQMFALLKHFCDSGDVMISRDNMFSYSLLESLLRGYKSYSWYLKQSKNMENILQAHEFKGEQGLSVIRKATLVITKKLHETEMERGNMNQEVVNGQAIVQQKDEQIGSMQDLLNEAKSALSTLQSQNQELKTVQMSMVSIESLEALQRDRDNKVSELEAVQMNLESIQEDNSTQAQIITEMEQRIVLLETRTKEDAEALKQKNKLLNQLNQELSEVNSYMQGKARELVALEEQRKQQQRQLDQQSSERASLQDRLQWAEAELQNKQNQLKIVEEGLQKREAALKNHDYSINRLTVELQQKSQELTDTKQLLTTIAQGGGGGGASGTTMTTTTTSHQQHQQQFSKAQQQQQQQHQQSQFEFFGNDNGSVASSVGGYGAPEDDIFRSTPTKGRYGSGLGTSLQQAFDGVEF